MAVSLALPYPVETTNPVPVVKSYGPWASVAAACAGVLQGVRHDGLTVMVTGTGEYWWRDTDLSDNGLILKSVPNSGGSGGGLLTYLFTFDVTTDGAQSFPLPTGTAGILGLVAQTSYGVTRLILPSHYRLRGGNLVVDEEASLKDGETLEGFRYTGGGSGGGTTPGPALSFPAPSLMQQVIGLTYDVDGLSTDPLPADSGPCLPFYDRTSRAMYFFSTDPAGTDAWVKTPIG